MLCGLRSSQRMALSGRAPATVLRNSRVLTRMYSQIPPVTPPKAESPAHDTQNDERMIGPYPRVKHEYYNERRQDIKYDDQQGRRNLGEPLHHQFDLIDVWSPDHFRQRSDATAARWELYFIGIIVGFTGLCYYLYEEPKFVRRYYPNGLKQELGGEESVPARVDASWK